MTKSFPLNLIALALGSVFLTGCGDAETTIIEQDPIVVEAPDDGHDHDDDGHDDHGDDIVIESLGRMAVLSEDSATATIIDLDDAEVLDSFTLTHASNRLSSSPGYRYVVVASRDNDYVGFIDGGLWREDHADHLHDYEQSPALSDFELMGSRPTHLVSHDGQLAIFYDGDANSSIPAMVQVLTDTDISVENGTLPTVNYDINMHGVAEPRGEHLLSTVRRDDAESTSNAKILPDQVAVYHWHDGEYEQEQILEVACPDLHGAAQNHEFVVFGCSDGILVAHQHDDEYEAEKIANVEGMEGMRVGNIYGHEASESFIGVASAHGGAHSVLLSINPEENEMEVLEWQPEEDASVVAYSFSADGEHFMVLDSHGHLNILETHEHDGHMHWELAGQIEISSEDLSMMPEGLSFSMAVAQSGEYVYVADPIAQHILQIHLEDMEVEGDMELDFAPKSIVWLGIAEEYDHEDGHTHD
ncbi:5-methyltetrahydrofolate--homocysteine methyltransferase [Planctobacterium marinum]|uniref:5-methyltetrahydrofolate--homocysteine methyltransferase n=1 Tax=Planctobacterium marinum TaxID=1631968 RepID=A0AA48HKR3_9ALTE|nr:hypothetical protein MACH26_25500 [Planctobacterium marinum]